MRPAPERFFQDDARFCHDEKEESRGRADILVLAEAVNAATPGDFMTRISPRFDLDRYLTFYAAEAATSYFDGFSFHNNNS